MRNIQLHTSGLKGPKKKCRQLSGRRWLKDLLQKYPVAVGKHVWFIAKTDVNICQLIMNVLNYLLQVSGKARFSGQKLIIYDHLMNHLHYKWDFPRVIHLQTPAAKIQQNAKGSRTWATLIRSEAPKMCSKPKANGDKSTDRYVFGLYSWFVVDLW
jgi:hypothetical protein